MAKSTIRITGDGFEAAGRKIEAAVEKVLDFEAPAFQAATVRLNVEHAFKTGYMSSMWVARKTSRFERRITNSVDYSVYVHEGYTHAKSGNKIKGRPILKWVSDARSGAFEMAMRTAIRGAV